MTGDRIDFFDLHQGRWVLAEALMTDGVNRLHEGEPELARSSLAKAAVLFQLVAPWGAYLTGFPEASERIAEIEGLLRTANEEPAGRDGSPRD